MKWYEALILSGVLLMGIIIGRWTMPSPDVAGETDEPGHMDQATRSHRVSTGSSSNSSMQSSRPGETGVISTTVNLPIEDLSALAGLSGIKTPDEEFLEDGEKLIEILDISESELDEIQRKWADGLMELRNAEANTVEVESDENATFLRLEGLSDVRNRLRLQFGSEVVNVLGPDRGQALIAFKGGDSLFGGEGEARSYRIASGGGEEGEFVIEEQIGEKKRIWLSEQVPRELNHLFRPGNSGQ